MLFLNELEELLELTQQEEFKIILVPLFTQLSRAIGSPHFQVAERALFLWHNDYISGLIADNRREILPIIYPVLHVNSESHWNLTVKNLTYNVLKIFMELDQPLVEQCSKVYALKKGKDEARAQQKIEYWIKLGVDVKDKSSYLLIADGVKKKKEVKERPIEASPPAWVTETPPVRDSSDTGATSDTSTPVDAGGSLGAGGLSSESYLSKEGSLGSDLTPTGGESVPGVTVLSA